MDLRVQVCLEEKRCRNRDVCNRRVDTVAWKLFGETADMIG